MPKAKEAQRPLTSGGWDRRPLRGHCSPHPAAASRGRSRGDLCRNCAEPAESPSSDPQKAWPAQLQIFRRAACDKTSPRISRPETGPTFRFRGAHANPAPDDCVAPPLVPSPPTHAPAHRTWPVAPASCHDFRPGGLGSIPGQGIKLLHAIQPSHPLLPPSPALNPSQQQGPFQ